MTYHVQKIGSNAEQLVIEELKNLGFKVDFVNSWYDLEVEKDNKKFLVEVKSTSLVLHNGVGCMRYGRFDFTESKNIKLQKKNNFIYVFVVHIQDSFEIIGCLKAKSVNIRRYFSLSRVMSQHKLKSIQNAFN